MTGKAFKRLQHVFLFHEGHLTIDLGELRLAVCPQVFVPEAFYDLEVPVHSPDHEQLLKGLGRLRQGVEFPCIHPAGDHKIPGTLWCGFDQVRGFHFDKTFPRKVFPHFHGHFVPEDELVFHRVPPDIQIAILHSEFLAPVGLVLDGKRRGLGRVQHLHPGDEHLDVTGRQFRVFSSPFDYLARYLQDEFPPGLPGLFQQFPRGAVLVEYQLGNPVAVAQVDPDDKPLVADLPRPAREGDLLAYM